MQTVMPMQCRKSMIWCTLLHPHVTTLGSLTTLTTASSYHWRSSFHWMTNSTALGLARTLVDRCRISDPSSNWHRCRWHRQRNRWTSPLTGHIPIQTKHRELPAKDATWNRTLIARISTASHTFNRSQNESCRFLTMYRCRMRSRAISRCQSIVWKSSYWPMPGISSLLSVIPEKEIPAPIDAKKKVFILIILSWSRSHWLHPGMRLALC